MKLGRFVLGPLVFSAFACGSAPKAEPATAAQATALTAATPEATDPMSTAEKWAEKKAAAETAKPTSREALDPLAVDSEMEDASIPLVELAPKGTAARARSAGELKSALSAATSASSVDEAARKLTQRLGKANWTEAPKSAPNAKRHVWIANAGATCYRLVLETDGTMDVESTSQSEWRMITGSARQNPCTGEIRRGVSTK